MARLSLSVRVVCVCLVSSFGGPAWSQQPETPKDQSKNKRTAWLHEVYQREASAYKFFLDDQKRQELKLRREPVMRWTSDADYNGEVYVWTHQGAAAIVGCIFSGPQGQNARHIMHEFHSLAPNPLYAGERGGSGWLPQEPGIRLEPVPDAPEPAKNQARRLAQMRDLARRFTSQVHRENSKWKMRLLTQPIYRYEISDANSPVVDGAVFAFVWTAGTDPEVLIVIEARSTDMGVRWHYAPARFTNCEAWLQYQGKEVWRADPATTGIFDGVTTTRYGAFQVKTIPNQGDE
ncbi:MAG: hypothetical protein ACHRXM_32905 [Isosphaerales bacterium]